MESQTVGLTGKVSLFYSIGKSMLTSIVTIYTYQRRKAIHDWQLDLRWDGNLPVYYFCGNTY